MALDWDGNDEIVSCPKCNKQYKYRESLRNHLRNDCGVERRFRCYICDYSCKRSKDLKTHVMHRHLKPKNPLGLHRCNKCNRTYQHKKHLVRHMNFECGVEPRFQCPCCPLKFKRNAHLARHMKGQHTLAYYNQQTGMELFTIPFEERAFRSIQANRSEISSSPKTGNETLNTHMNLRNRRDNSIQEKNHISKNKNEISDLLSNVKTEFIGELEIHESAEDIEKVEESADSLTEKDDEELNGTVKVEDEKPDDDDREEGELDETSSI